MKGTETEELYMTLPFHPRRVLILMLWMAGTWRQNVGDDTLDIAVTVLEKVLNGCMSPRDAAREDVFIEVSNQLETLRKRLCGSRAAAL